ncbi:hypothetical protein [Rhizobium leguminosarum]|uniref:hypothetical protein n=1 Tax=Rhizobium leguminosarum TaxID=384 RepID=UPI003F9CFEB8
MIGNAVALLAPVPEEHLVSGLLKCHQVGKIAFGSRSFQLFRDLDAARGTQPVDVYIYASASVKFGLPKIRWQARYTGHVEARAGSHPDATTYRPESTLKYESDNEGHWAVFWEVVDLRELSKGGAIPMNLFRSWRSRKYFVSTFIPEGPLLVECPQI